MEPEHPAVIQTSGSVSRDAFSAAITSIDLCDLRKEYRERSSSLAEESAQKHGAVCGFLYALIRASIEVLVFALVCAILRAVPVRGSQSVPLDAP